MYGVIRVYLEDALFLVHLLHHDASFAAEELLHALFPLHGPILLLFGCHPPLVGFLGEAPHFEALGRPSPVDLDGLEDFPHGSVQLDVEPDFFFVRRAYPLRVIVLQHILRKVFLHHVIFITLDASPLVHYAVFGASLCHTAVASLQHKVAHKSPYGTLAAAPTPGNEIDVLFVLFFWPRYVLVSSRMGSDLGGLVSPGKLFFGEDLPVVHQNEGLRALPDL